VTTAVQTFDMVAPLVGHAQLADWPGRGAPGTGTLELERLVEHLDRAEYAGAVGFEYLPDGSTVESLAFLERTPWTRWSGARASAADSRAPARTSSLRAPSPRWRAGRDPPRVPESSYIFCRIRLFNDAVMD
jgi:hypothetical protein